MNLNGPELVEPVFRFLDRMIESYGLYIYMGMVYAAIPLIVWILSGGLRRRLQQRTPPQHTHIVVIRPPPQPSPLPQVSRRDHFGDTDENLLSD
jgi:hypothetical protein